MKPSGLHNIGANCYLNALLQSLMSCTHFHNLLDKIKSNPITFKSSSPLVKAFVTGLDNDPSFSSTVFHTYRAMLQNKSIKDKMKRNFGSSQEDSSELFHILMELTSDERFSSIFRIKTEMNIGCPDTREIISKKIEDNLEMQLDVPNGDYSQKEWEEYIMKKLTTDIEVMEPEYDKNTKKIIGGYRCNKCNKIHTVRKVTFITGLANIIVLSFKKFQMKKNIHFPQSLTFMSNTQGEEVPITYDLVAIINHSGTMSGGHYYADIKRGDKYYRANDSMVSEIGSLVPQSDSYMAFYNFKES